MMFIIVSEANGFDERLAKTSICLAIYVSMCFSVLVLAVHESTAQPIGLLVVAMVMTPIIVSICGGLPVDFMQSKAKLSIGNLNASVRK